MHMHMRVGCIALHLCVHMHVRVHMHMQVAQAPRTMRERSARVSLRNCLICSSKGV